MKEMHIKLTFLESILGTCPSNSDLYRDFIATKAPDASTIEDEVAAIGADAVAGIGGGSVMDVARLEMGKQCVEEPSKGTAWNRIVMEPRCEEKRSNGIA